MKSLFDDLRSSENLFSAWRHVKQSALNSKNGKIRGEASEFEHQHQRHLKRIQAQLREGSFKFDDVEGVLKDKRAREAAGKDPRPIAIGSIKNRVVQRALLQILQPRKVVNISDPNSKSSPKLDSRLGSLNDVNRSRFGVGGLMSPYGGVKPAISLVMESMSEGAQYFFQSDIKAFFTKIPTVEIVKKVKKETNDEGISALFSKALEVNLANKEELLSYARIFPSDGVGVAQGSSLSAFAGNVLLYDLDHRLNEMGVSAVRYIDDIFMLSDTEAALEAAIGYAETELSGLGFALYTPTKGSNKAARGLCTDSFCFLGCTIQPNRCVPSKPSVDKIKKDVHQMLSRSKRAIDALVGGKEDFDPRQARSAVIDRIGRKILGWEKSYAFCTDGQAFGSLDKRIAEYVNAYDHAVSRKISKSPIKLRMISLGIPSTEDLFNHDQVKNKEYYEKKLGKK